jgi:hypothetical protein
MPRAYSHSQAFVGGKNPPESLGELGEHIRDLWKGQLSAELSWVHLHVLTQNTARLEAHA